MGLAPAPPTPGRAGFPLASRGGATAAGLGGAVAVGTPGIGYVSTGLLPVHVTDVLPIVITSAASLCGLGVIEGGSDVPANAALNAPCGPDHRRIIRSSTVAGIGVALPFPGTSSAP